MGEKTLSIIDNLPISGYLSLQSIILVIHYGFNKILPFWVLWFPSLVLGLILFVALVILLLVFIGSLFN